ncbi:MAG: sugar nucleotide-binding protein [Candidatus Peribacteraceae bacterium]|nr:sugar nucleotide-binding protein [Candidatus Peribacteraceae bacterium]MDD5742674.1 sugar nucleotide-binding protein [Candidatus Peribacteraceae bacterium]
MKVLLFGGRGFMGEQFLKIFPDAVCPSVDIADPGAVAQVLDQEKPDIVINAAGRTGVPNVDWCEDHKLETLRSNVTGPLVLLEECAKRGIYWVHLSSGCIYEGQKRQEGEEGKEGVGWTEEDEPNFSGSFYSRSKAWSEKTLRECTVRDVRGRSGILILRLRMPFDGSTHPKNLLTKLARFERVLDVPNSITYLPDFLAAAKTLVERRSTGIYNVVNDGVISPYRIVELYRELVDPAHRFERLLVSSLPQVVRAGRSNCVLSTSKLREQGIHLRPVEEAVRESLLEFKKTSWESAESTIKNKNCVQY